MDKERKISEDSTVEDLEERIDRAGSEVERRILKISAQAPEHRRALQDLRDLVRGLLRLVDQTKQMAQEYEDDRSKFVHLAGIGLMVEFILHELGRATARALDVLSDIDRAPLKDTASAALDTLEDLEEAGRYAGSP
ncbi:MAG: hypothetical protein ACREJ0_05475 [Geminicoccaceae bacterium]